MDNFKLYDTAAYHTCSLFDISCHNLYYMRQWLAFFIDAASCQNFKLSDTSTCHTWLVFINKLYGSIPTLLKFLINGSFDPVCFCRRSFHQSSLFLGAAGQRSWAWITPSFLGKNLNLNRTWTAETGPSVSEPVCVSTAACWSCVGLWTFQLKAPSLQTSTCCQRSQNKVRPTWTQHRCRQDPPESTCQVSLGVSALSSVCRLIF